MLTPANAEVMEQFRRKWVCYTRHLRYMFMFVWNYILGWLNGAHDRLNDAILQDLSKESDEPFSAFAWFETDTVCRIEDLGEYYYYSTNGLHRTRLRWEQEFAVLRYVAFGLGEEVEGLFDVPFNLQPEWEMVCAHYVRVHHTPRMPRTPEVPLPENALAIIEGSGIDFDALEAGDYIRPWEGGEMNTRLTWDRNSDDLSLPSADHADWLDQADATEPGVTESVDDAMQLHDDYGNCGADIRSPQEDGGVGYSWATDDEPDSDDGGIPLN